MNDLAAFINKAIPKIEKQMTFAASMAINEIAKDVKVGVERQLKADIDKPTPFTQKAFKVNRSSKKSLVSSVEIKPIQAAYLKYQIEGGSKRNKTVIIPRKKARNKYGNLPRGKLKKLSDQGKTYKANGLVIQQLKTKKKPLAYITDKADYKKRFKFFQRAHSTAKKVASRRLNSAIKKALSTAR